MKLSLNQVSNKLIELAEEEGALYPEYYQSELEYMNLKAKTLMSAQVAGLVSQPQREAECQRILSLTPEYKKYHEIAPRYHVHEIKTKIYLQLARNLTAMSFNQ